MRSFIEKIYFVTFNLLPLKILKLSITINQKYFATKQKKIFKDDAISNFPHNETVNKSSDCTIVTRYYNDHTTYTFDIINEGKGLFYI